MRESTPKLHYPRLQQWRTVVIEDGKRRVYFRNHPQRRHKFRQMWALAIFFRYMNLRTPRRSEAYLKYRSAKINRAFRNMD